VNACLSVCWLLRQAFAHSQSTVAYEHISAQEPTIMVVVPYFTRFPLLHFGLKKRRDRSPGWMAETRGLHPPGDINPLRKPNHQGSERIGNCLRMFISCSSAERRAPRKLRRGPFFGGRHTERLVGLTFFADKQSFFALVDSSRLRSDISPGPSRSCSSAKVPHESWCAARQNVVENG